ncbi:MAG: ankyrin repeat domain-containing protein [Planctomycetes bacterium]|nr:ankyrin repeat domain-containing protein [Planctomycetota bacterium]
MAQVALLFGILLLPMRPVGDETADRALFAAIRDGKRQFVEKLLQNGADVNASDDTGASALMYAALNSDAAMMELLLKKGAKVDAKNKVGTVALQWALHDFEKMKLLLDHGATIPEDAVFLGAGLANSRQTLKLLAEKGAKLNVSRGGFTPLMAAIIGGDRDTIDFLLEQGADVKAKTKSGYTALHAAAWLTRDDTLVKRLLEMGADPKTQASITEPADDVFTPLMGAAVRGKPQVVIRLLNADVNVNAQGGAFGRTALLMAATTGDVETVKALLAHGTDVHAKDNLGQTALDWAKRRGGTEIAKLLEKAAAKEVPREITKLEPLHKTIDGDSIRSAVNKSLALLQSSGAAFTARKGCVSCHHQSLPAMAVGLARKRGFSVDEKTARQERDAVVSTLSKNRERNLLGGGVTDDLVPAFTLAAFAAEEQKPSALTDALVHFLTLRQKRDGSWRTPVYRPPHDASDFTFTALAVRGLRDYATKGRAKEMEKRIALARSWLENAKPAETEDKAFQLLGLRWANADPKLIQKVNAALLAEQRNDGGWMQLETLPSDAYATGQVLFALHEGGGLAIDDKAYKRGVYFLLKTQLADGSWFVQTRSFPFQPHVNSRFPHGRSQFISAAATAWATMALTLVMDANK